MAAYRRVYDSRHLQADCQERGSAWPENLKRNLHLPALCRRRTRATTIGRGNVRKSVEDRTYTLVPLPEIFSRTGTYIRTDRHAHRNTPLLAEGGVIEDCFSFNPSSHTRGRAYKLYKARCAKGTRQNFFVCRVINVWNSLPNTVCFNSQASFKRSLKGINFSEFLKCY